MIRYKCEETNWVASVYDWEAAHAEFVREYIEDCVTDDRKFFPIEIMYTLTVMPRKK